MNLLQPAMPAADWISERLSAIPAATVHRDESAGADLVVRFGDGPAIALQVVNLAQTGTLAIARMVEGGLPRARDGRPLLYTTPQLKPELRAHMAAARLSWIERRGAIHLDVGPYYIHEMPVQTGASRRKDSDVNDAGLESTARPARLVGRSGVCAEALILWWHATRHAAHHPPPLTQTTLAEVAGVTAPLAGRVLHRLEALGALTPERTGKRTRAWHVANAEHILQTWVEEDRDTVRTTRAYVYARHFGEMRTRLAGLSRMGHPWAIGGVAAANLYAPTLTADPMPTVWIAHDLPPATAAKAVHGEIVTEGSNVVFCQVPKDPWAVFRAGEDDMQHAHVAPAPRPSVNWLRAHLRDTLTKLPRSDSLTPVCIVSPARALQQTLQEEKGRSMEVALALSGQLGVTHG